MYKISILHPSYQNGELPHEFIGINRNDCLRNVIAHYGNNYEKTCTIVYDDFG